MPSSRHAKMMRIATSPRLAMRIFLNMTSRPTAVARTRDHDCATFDREQPFAVLDGLAVLDVDVHDLAVVLRVDLVHQLHRFDDAEHLPLLHGRADLDERRRPRLRRTIERADNGRLHDGELDVGVEPASVTTRRAGGCRRRGAVLQDAGAGGADGGAARGETPAGVPRRVLPDLEPQPVVLDFELRQLVLAHEVEDLLQLLEVHQCSIARSET